MADINVLVENALLNAFGANFNDGIINIYAGDIPATMSTSLSDAILMGSLTFINPAFRPATNAAIIAYPITACNYVLATDIATFYRILKADGTTVIEQGTVGEENSGADIILDDTSFEVGDTIEVASFIRTL